VLPLDEAAEVATLPPDELPEGRLEVRPPDVPPDVVEPVEAPLPVVPELLVLVPDVELDPELAEVACVALDELLGVLALESPEPPEVPVEPPLGTAHACLSQISPSSHSSL
jgi:hypothetical protein